MTNQFLRVHSLTPFLSISKKSLTSQERRNQAPLMMCEQVVLGSVLQCSWGMQHTYQRWGRKRDCILGSVEAMRKMVHLSQQMLMEQLSRKTFKIYCLRISIFYWVSFQYYYLSIYLTIYWICLKHCTKQFICIFSFKLHNNLMR